MSVREAFVNERLNFLVFVGKPPPSLSANVLWHSFHVGQAFGSLVIFFFSFLVSSVQFSGTGWIGTLAPTWDHFLGVGEGAEGRGGQIKFSALHLICISRKM